MTRRERGEEGKEGEGGAQDREAKGEGGRDQGAASICKPNIAPTAEVRKGTGDRDRGQSSSESAHAVSPADNMILNLWANNHERMNF